MDSEALCFSRRLPGSAGHLFAAKYSLARYYASLPKTSVTRENNLVVDASNSLDLNSTVSFVALRYCVVVVIVRIITPGQIVQQMYVIACVLGAGLQTVLLTQAPAILALMGAGPSTALFKDASGYLKVRGFPLMASL